MTSTKTKNLKLNQLRLISAIAEHGQLSIAANSLSITQPAASRTLAEIEQILGTKLFERRAKGMELSLIGKVMAERANKVLIEMREISREVEELKLGIGGVARVGAVTGAAVTYVVPALQQLKKTSPYAEIHVEVGSSDVLVRDLMAGVHDFVLGRIPPIIDSRNFDVTRAQTETVDLIVRSGHELTDRGILSLRDLESYEWIIQSVGAPIRSAIETSFLDAGATMPRQIINTTSLLVMIAMLASSDGIVAMSREMSELLIDSKVGGNLVALPLEEKIVVAPYYLIEVKGRKLSPVSDRLKTLVMQQLES